MATCPGRGSVHREPPSATRPCRALQCRKREVGALAADRAHRCRWRLWSRWHAQQQPADALPIPHQAGTYDAGSRLTPQTIQPTARHCARSARRAADLDRQGMWSARCQLPVDSGHVRCVERSRRCSLTFDAGHRGDPLQHRHACRFITHAGNVRSFPLRSPDIIIVAAAEA